MLLHFVETPIFSGVVERYLGDDAYRELQLELLDRPGRGPMIRGSGGLRKIRWAERSGGRRGGLRIIYYWDPLRATVYLLYAYRKAARADLSREQIRALRRLTVEEFG